jgi:threonine synthase
VKILGAQFANYIGALVCTRCGQRYAPQQSLYSCLSCGPVEGLLEADFDLGAVNRDFAWSDLVNAPSTMWRYGPLLPLTPQHLGATWPIGFTPMFDAPVLAQACGTMRLLIKDDGRNPNGTVVDRSASIAAIRAAEAGAKAVATVGAQEAATSLAAWAAAAAVPARVFISADIPLTAVSGAQHFGAEVVRVRGAWADTVRLCIEACEAFGWYSAIDGHNPYLLEGRKSLGLELAEQCMAEPPEWIAVNMADSITLLALAKGLRQMRQLELVDWSPKLLGVGPEAPTPRVQATIAESDGAWVVLDAAAAADMQKQVATSVGMAVDLVSAATLAGIRLAISQQLVARRAPIVACLTGRGDLGITPTAPLAPVREVDANLDALRSAIAP